MIEYISIYQPVCCDPNLGREDILSGSRKNYFHDDFTKCVIILISLNHKNFTFVVSIHVFFLILHLSLFLTHRVAGQSY
jgi:hypothetical protein